MAAEPNEWRELTPIASDNEGCHQERAPCMRRGANTDAGEEMPYGGRR